MKILLVGAGASFSTKDVEVGYLEAFQELGIDTTFYLLDQRIAIADKWLKFVWRHLYKSDPERKPTWAEVIYRGGIEALEMALRYDVDWVFVISAMYLHPDAIIMMRRAGLKVAVLFTESPYQDNLQVKVSPLVNTCFTNERTSLPFLREYNKETYYIRHAYSPYRHYPSAYNESGEIPQHDVVFVGSGFQERLDLFKAVTNDWTKLGIDLGLYGTWALLPSRHKVRRFIKGGVVKNSGATDLYKASKIGLNLYRTSIDYHQKTEHILSAESLNPRAYELAACGTFSISNYRKEAVETFFTAQPTFETSEELTDIVNYYLTHEDHRQKAAKQVLERVQGHTFTARATEVLNLMGAGCTSEVN